jgi:hypothetical protein
MESIPFADILEENVVPPSELTEDEASTIEYLSRAVLDSIPLRSLGIITIDEIYGDQIDAAGEDLFLSAMVDETQPLQSELAARLCGILDMQDLVEPDRFSCQVFKRKGGYTTKGDTDLIEICQYCMAVCLKDYQIVRFEDKEYLLYEGMTTPLFEIKPKASRPSIPKNKTQVKLANGKATIKSKKYISILAWAFWCHDPKKENNKEINTEALHELVNNMKVTNSQEIQQPIPKDEEIIL